MKQKNSLKISKIVQRIRKKKLMHCVIILLLERSTQSNTSSTSITKALHRIILPISMLLQFLSVIVPIRSTSGLCERLGFLLDSVVDIILIPKMSMVASLIFPIRQVTHGRKYGMVDHGYSWMLLQGRKIKISSKI